MMEIAVLNYKRECTYQRCVCDILILCNSANILGEAIMSDTPIPERFQPAYHYIKQLEQYERYLGAFIFGSLARGEATEHSDLDVKVAINEDNPCNNINHPVINGVKLDITFNSLQQLKTFTDDEMERRERVPLIAESLIIFDKTGALVEMREMARQIRP